MAGLRASPEREGHPLASSLFFPLSGDPVGFNHFAAAEVMLRADPTLERVVFVVSNGIHPDPKKPHAELDTATRHEILRAATRAIDDPRRSTLARQAELAGERLRIGAERIRIDLRELAVPRAVRAAETVAALRAEQPDEPVPIHWCAGSDLVRRMADPAIFSEDDLRLLARECRLHVLERQGECVDAAAAAVERVRGVRLALRAPAPSAPPVWLAPFLRLSSTHIRRAAEAANPLAGMLPLDAAELIATRGLYRPGRAAAHLVDVAGEQIGDRSQLELDVARLTAELTAQATRLGERLDQLREAGRPHSLAIVETSAGGLLTTALAGRSGASRTFRQARFAYNATAKANLIGDDAARCSAVSEEMVALLAAALRRDAETDFALAESGMAGPPDGRHRSLRNGECWFACATPSGTTTDHVALHPFETRREHQLRFALHALSWLEKHLE